jgi:hypothetical protein
MHTQEPGFGWSGPARRLGLALSLALWVGACASWPPSIGNDSARDHLQFLAHAMTADPPVREALWQANRSGNPSAQTVLRRALLQSVPGHSGHDAAAAERDLEQLLKRNPPAGIFAVAQVRLEELKATRDMRAELESMKERLARVVDIERKLKSNGR